jgi:hypothetical protein
VSKDDHPLFHGADDRLEQTALAATVLDPIGELRDQPRHRRCQLSGGAAACHDEGPAGAVGRRGVDLRGQRLDLSVERPIHEPSDGERKDERRRAEDQSEAEGLDPGELSPRGDAHQLDDAESQQDDRQKRDALERGEKPLRVHAPLR